MARSSILAELVHQMTVDPDHGFGLLSPDDQEKIELILTERSHGSHGAPALHGLLTASVMGLNQCQWIGYCKQY
jgi:hypothetical protein